MTAEPAPVPSEESIRIPTLPASVDRVRGILGRPDVAIADVVEAFLADPPLTARVLRIANSAYYGRREKTISVPTALSFLGLRALSTVVLRAGVLATFENLGLRERASVEAIWRHSVLTGQIAGDLARRVRRRVADLCAEDHHTCGLLHDVGKIVLYGNFGEPYGDLLRREHDRGEALEVEEQRVFGMRHSDVGHMAATFWGIPEPVPGMIRQLHRRVAPKETHDLTLLVRCADEIANAVARKPQGDVKAVRGQLATALPGLSETGLSEVVAAALEAWDRLEV